MKKTTALFLALSLLLLVSGAFAANPIAVGITAIDYQTGAVIGPKNYSVNELFTVRVTVSIPRFTDTKSDRKAPDGRINTVRTPNRPTKRRILPVRRYNPPARIPNCGNTGSLLR